MKPDRIALILVCCGVALWALAMLGGLIATLPWGLPALLVFGVIGYLVVRVVRDRLGNAEDDYYERHVDR